jgi:hypothetical protein
VTGNGPAAFTGAAAGRDGGRAGAVLGFLIAVGVMVLGL